MTQEVLSGSLAKASSLLGWGVRNLIRNGGFTPLGPLISSAPPYWARVSTPTINLLANTAYGDDVSGAQAPLKVRITAGGANQGLTQTIPANSLKQSTVYTLSWKARANAGDTWQVTTTGGSVNVSQTDTNFVFAEYSAQFTTDSTPSAVVVNLLAVANGDIVEFDDVQVTEGTAGPRPFLPHALDQAVQAFTVQRAGVTEYWPGLKLEAGSISESAHPTTVTFGVGFQNAPFVVCTIQSANVQRLAIVTAVSAASFSVKVVDTGGVDQTETIHWIAVGI